MKKQRKKILFLAVLLGLSIVCIAALAACDFTYRFTVSGKVTVNGVPVEGVTVRCEIAETTTDAEGKYVLSDLTGEVRVEFLSDDYWFPSTSGKLWTDATVDMTAGKKLRTVSGKCVNGDTPVANATVTLEAVNKSMITVTDEQGLFAVPGLAGDVVVSATADGQEMFGQTLADGENEFLILQATTQVKLRFVAEENLSVGEFRVVFGERSEKIRTTDSAASIDKICFGTEFTLVSDRYGFDKQTFSVDRADEIVDIKVFDKYDVDGTVVCGTGVLAGADVSADGTKLTQTDANGKFVLSGLFGSHTLSFVKRGYETQTVAVDKNNCDVAADLFAKVNGVVRDDFGKTVENVNLSAGERSALTDRYGKFSLLVKNGETLTADKHGYRFDAVEVDGTADISVVGKLLYDVSLTVTGDCDGLTVIVGDDEITVGTQSDGIPFENGIATLRNLYGAKRIVFQADGYRADGTTNVDAAQTKATLNVNKLYSLTKLVAASGDVPVAYATVYVNDVVAAVSDERGLFDIVVARGDVVKAVAEGYDEFVTEYDALDGLKIDFTYTLNFAATNDKLHYDLIVDGVLRSVAGHCSVTGLSGTTTVQAVKDYHVFDVDGSGSASATYTIGGSHTLSYTYTAKVSVSKNKTAAAGATVVLFDNESDAQPVEKIADDSGTVTFEGLDSTYTLICNDMDGVRFKPEYITVGEGGLYVFADVGYSVNVKVLVGGEPLSDVVLTYAGRTSRTSSSGEYKLNLFDATSVTLAKEGYTFDKAQLDLVQKDDEKTIVINATYRVQGKVTSGSAVVSGATVAVGELATTTDVNGEYVLEGISSITATMRVAKDGFVLAEKKICGYDRADVTLYADVRFEFVSGDIVIADVVASVNGNATDKFVLGDKVTFDRDGYLFESVIVDEQNIGGTVVVNATYTVSGSVSSGNVAAAGVQVVSDGKVLATTESDGRFTVAGLVGKTTLQFVSDEYDIAPVRVEGPCVVNATATYDVTLRVTCGDRNVSGVAVKIKNKTVAVTDENGVAVINSLGGENTLSLSLDGYSFEGNNKVDGACELTFSATYTVSGSVKVGDVAVSRVNVESEGKVVAQTDANGNFTVSGLSGEATLTFVKDGYEIQNLAVTQPVKATVSAKFYVDVEFDGDISGAKAYVNDDEVSVTDSFVRFGPFDGETVIVFAKDGYTFSPSQIRATDYVARSVGAGRAYSVSGKVTTSNGLPVVGMTMFASDQKTVTDSEGKYSFASLAGSVQVSGKFEFNADSKNLYNHDCATGGSKIITTDAQNVDFTIADTAYAWALYEANYLVRLGKYGNTPYKISGGADVTATMGVKTAGGFVKIKDAKGNVITESANYGKSVMGVDPSVGVVNFAYAGSDKVTYAQVNGGSNVPAANKANYSSATFKDTTDSGYADIYGASPQGILIYKITEGTVSSASVAKEGSGYKLSLELKTTAEMFAAYKKQIKEMSGVDMQSFEYVRLYITLDSNTYVTSIRIEEKYSVKTMGVTATSTAVATHTYTYTNIPDLSSFKADNATVQKLLGR